MAEYQSSNNAWVDLYLTALLGDGLSKEYVKSPRADNAAHTNYFFNLILDDDEGIIHSWRRAQASTQTDAIADPSSMRREYQAWRIWGLKMARERAAHGANLLTAEDDSGPINIASTLETAESGSMTPLGTSWDVRAGGDSMAAFAARSPARPPHLESGASALPIVRTAGADGAASADLVGDSPGSAVSVGDGPRENPFKGRVDRLYIVLISAHGLVRGTNMELGKDADTGGQVKYVVELARTLANHPMVHRVELMTRLIQAPGVADDYGQEEEELLAGAGQHGGAYIVRVKAGSSREYLPKEALWPHLREFADNGLVHVHKMQKAMAEAGEPCNLYAVHGHYADAGEVAALMSHTLAVPMVLTGHSLGRNKLDHLLRGGTMTRQAIEETYAISRRIEGEERSLDAAIMAVTSTQQEVDQQWGLYDGFDPKMVEALQFRSIPGRAMPLMQVIPPGLDFSSLKVELPADPMQLFVEYAAAMSTPGDMPQSLVAGVTPPSASAAAARGPSELRFDELSSPKSRASGGASGPLAADGKGGLMSQAFAPGSAGPGSRSVSRAASRSNLQKVPSNAGLAMDALASEPEIWKAVQRFLQNPAKPVVLAMSRPDAKKNLTTLVKAFGSNPALRELANLVLIMGNRDNIDHLAKGSQQVLNSVLKLIDTYDLYGSVAYPKAHSQADISDIYLLARNTKGVFVNIALQEPFGLTLIEAAVHGVPIVATKHGGPVDIVATLKNGTIVEPTDEKAVSAAILDIILSKDKWSRYSSAGIKNILAYSWPSHCIRYLERIESVRQAQKRTLRHANTRHQARHSYDNNAATGELRDLDEEGHSRPLSMALATGNAADDFDVARRSAAGGHAGSFQAPTALDDLDIDSRTGFGRSAHKLRISGRSRLVYAILDTTFDMALLANALQTTLTTNDGALAVGVVTVLTFTEIRHELEAAGVTVSDLDFIVCNCGAYIMLYDQEDDTWVADDEWEEKCQHCWDKQLVVRTLTRMQMNRPKSSENSDRPSDLMRLLKAANGVDVNDGNGPLHVLLDFDPQENAPLEAIDNATLIDRVRKRARRRGIRCNLTLQLIPAETEGDKGTRSIVHATPLRASRALALRHMVQKYELDMAEAVFLCTPASVQYKSDKQAGTTIGALCSDMATLLEGAQRVVVVPPTKEVGLSQAANTLSLPAKVWQGSMTSNHINDLSARDVERVTSGRDAVAFQRLKVTLEPYDEARVTVIPDANKVKGALEQVLCGTGREA